MNHDDRSDDDACPRRRPRGAHVAGVGTAVGAALAAAMIPAAVAYADPNTGAPVTSGGSGMEQTAMDNAASAFLGREDISTSLATSDVWHLNNFIGELPGGASGQLGTVMEESLASIFEDFGTPTSGLKGSGEEASLNNVFSNFLAQEDISTRLATIDVTYLDDFLGQLPGGAHGAVGIAFEMDLANDIATIAALAASGQV
jgi:hypothetical protein